MSKKEITPAVEIEIVLGANGLPETRDADGKIIVGIPRELYIGSKNEALAAAIEAGLITQSAAHKVRKQYALDTEREIYLPRWQAKVAASEKDILELTEEIENWDAEDAPETPETKLAKKATKLMAMLAKAQKELAELRGEEI